MDILENINTEESDGPTNREVREALELLADTDLPIAPYAEEMKDTRALRT